MNKSTRRNRRPVHRKEVDVQGLKRKSLIDKASWAIYGILDKRGPEDWREDALFSIRLDKAIAEEIDLYMAGVSSPAQMDKALEIRSVVEKAGKIPHLVL